MKLGTLVLGHFINEGAIITNRKTGNYLGKLTLTSFDKSDGKREIRLTQEPYAF